MNVGAEDMAKPSGIVTFLFTDIEGGIRCFLIPATNE